MTKSLGVRPSADAPTDTNNPPHSVNLPRSDREDIFTPSQHLTESRRRNLLFAIATAIVVCGWAAINIANGWVGFATIVPYGFRGGMEASISLARLFAALVLILIISDRLNTRLQWLASGFVVLGLGQLAFGYFEPILVDTTSLNTSLYEMILVRTVAAALFVVGLVPRSPPRFTWHTALAVAVLTLACIVTYWLLTSFQLIPELVRIESLEEAERLRIAPWSWMTTWHWVLAALPFGLAIIAAIAAFLRHGSEAVGFWLPLSIILLAGSELHDALWPSAYGNSVLMNTADVLRLAMAAVVVGGGVFELRRIASERAHLLIAEQERAGRLEDLSAIKADFTAMVAHELGHPLSAIRRQTELLSLADLDQDLRQSTLAAIIRETNALDALVADVQASATVERDEFSADLRPVPLGDLMQAAVASAEDHSQTSPLHTCLNGVDERQLVLADADRIGQVLRNLLSNASKHAPHGTQISLQASSTDNGRIRIDVADAGPGIHPDDLPRIFEKFGRGRNGSASGDGVGLYLSRRIVRAHGSDLTVRSTIGEGSVFTFELGIIQSTELRHRP